MPKKFGAMHDVILFYCKDYGVWGFANPWKPLLQEEIESKFPNVDKMGRRWKDDSAHIWGIPFDAKRPNLCYEWRGFTNPDNKCWRFMKSRLEEEYQKGNFVIIMKNGKRKLQRRMYADTYRGERMDDFWDDILIPLGRKKVGYPTTHPEAPRPLRADHQGEHKRGGHRARPVLRLRHHVRGRRKTGQAVGRHRHLGQGTQGGHRPAPNGGIPCRAERAETARPADNER